jgi:hypothetical protein
MAPPCHHEAFASCSGCYGHLDGSSSVQAITDEKKPSKDTNQPKEKENIKKKMEINITSPGGKGICGAGDDFGDECLSRMEILRASSPLRMPILLVSRQGRPYIPTRTDTFRLVVYQPKRNIY